MMLTRNTSATFEAQFMKKLTNTEGELLKSVVYKKTCILKEKHSFE